MPNPKIIYFDQRGWINLTKQPYRTSLLPRLQAKARRGTILVPLSFGNIIETVRTPDREQRARLAEIMISLSDGTTISPQWALVLPELECAIARLFDLPQPPPPVAFGKGVDLAFAGSHHDQLRAKFGADAVNSLSKFLSTKDGIATLLTGLSDTAFLSLSQAFIEGAAQHTALAELARTSLKSRSPVFRKRMYAAALASSLDEEIRDIASKLNVSYDQLLALGHKGLMRLFADVPCLNVEIELGTLRHTFWNRVLAPNDMVDLATLASAIPYCDAVLTEKFWADLAHRAKVDIQYSTFVSHDLKELVDSLD